MGQVKLYVWECRASLFSWRLYRTFKNIDDEEINTKIIIALEEGPYMEMYRWECFNSLGQFQGNIFNNMIHTFKYEYLTNI